MAHQFELEIHKLMKEYSNPIQVADELLKRWDNGQLSWLEQESAGNFLIHAGFGSALLQQIAKALKAKQKIPWSCLVEILGHCQLRLSKEEIDQIMIGANEEESLEDVVRSRALDSQDPRFERIRTQTWNERPRLNPPPFASAHGTRFTVSVSVPGSDRTRPNIENIKVRKSTLTEWAKRAEEMSADIKERNEKIAAEMIERAHQNKKSAYNIAVSLHLMGLPDKALLALKAAPKTVAAHWLELDLLIETHRFLEGIAKAEYLEKKFTSDPDSIFSATYSKAIALQGLGRHKEAVELLEGIVKVKPSYRSAHSLLLKWKADEP